MNDQTKKPEDDEAEPTLKEKILMVLAATIERATRPCNVGGRWGVLVDTDVVNSAADLLVEFVNGRDPVTEAIKEQQRNEQAAQPNMPGGRA